MTTAFNNAYQCDFNSGSMQNNSFMNNASLHNLAGYNNHIYVW